MIIILLIDVLSAHKLSQNYCHRRFLFLHWCLSRHPRWYHLHYCLAAIYANNEKKDIIDNSDEGFINASLIIVYVLSIVFLVLGLCGLYGGCKTRKKNNKLGNCLLGVYFVGVFIFLILFAGSTIFFFVGPSSIIGDNCQEGSKTMLIQELYNAN